jgi:hypothetical protein
MIKAGVINGFGGQMAEPVNGLINRAEASADLLQKLGKLFLIHSCGWRKRGGVMAPGLSLRPALAPRAKKSMKRMFIMLGK